MRLFPTLPLAAVLTAGLVLTAPSMPSATAPAAANEIPGSTECTPDPRYAKADFRGMWIASVVNIDWPAKRGQSAQAQQQQLIDWFDLAVSNNFNAVVLQVRPTADTFWPSDKEPWSRWLTGTQGQDPGYDPLAFAVEQAHARGLQLHAWFNPYRVTMTKSLKNLTPDHPAKLNPDWVIRKDGKWYYNPGIPEVRAHVVDTIMEAVTNYDIDGVHFDDYFYPYPGSGKPFKDKKTFQEYGQGMTRADWRRANTDALIKELSDRIEATKPWVQFGVSPFAVWRNQRTDPEGSATRAGVQNYDQLYADTRKWVREGWIDYIAPQIYWTRGFKIADYETITRWWADEIDVAAANGHNVGLYIGEATYRAGTKTSKDWRKRNVLVKHRKFTRTFPQVGGAIYFSAKDVKADRRKTTTRLVNRYYSRPAIAPGFGTATTAPPQAPTNIRDRNGQITWSTSDPNVVSYAIYQVPTTTSTDCAFMDARHLAAVTPANATNQWSAPSNGEQVFISAVDRWGRESDTQAASG